MATAVQNITLSAPRNIPLSKLVLSQANVRCVKAGASIETFLQVLSARPVLEPESQETGMFEVPVPRLPGPAAKPARSRSDPFLGLAFGPL